MAVNLHLLAPASASSLHSRHGVSQPPLSCAIKVFVGLRPQASAPFGTAKPNLTVQFYEKVYQSVYSRHTQNKPTRGRFFMMPIGTPMVPYRSPGEGTWQWLDIWNVLYRERVIFLQEHIDEEQSNLVLATMLYLDSVDSSKKLNFYISSTGGDLTPTMALYDTMQSLESPIATHCICYAFNLAGFLLAAGDKGQRSAMPHSRISLEPPAGSARGRADDIRNETNELLRIRDYLFKELAKHTGQPVEKIYKDLRRKKPFNAHDALEYGLIDRIVRPARIRADAPRKDVG